MNKAQAEQTRLMLAGMLAEATDEERKQVNEAKAAIQTAVTSHKDAGKVALTIILIEMAARGEFE